MSKKSFCSLDSRMRYSSNERTAQRGIEAKIAFIGIRVLGKNVALSSFACKGLYQALGPKPRKLENLLWHISLL